MFQTHWFPNFLIPGVRTPLVHPRTLQQQPTRRRTLDIKTKRPRSTVDNHLYLHGYAGDDMGCSGVKFFAKVDGFETSGTQDGADGRGGGSLAGWTDEFY
jgi:hypothetical protein